MKKILIPAIALATLASCGGGTGTGTTQQNADSTAAGDGGDAINRVSTYQYVEPTEDIAKIIFDSLANDEFDYGIWNAVAEADDDNELDECFESDSKTHRYFSQNKWSRYDGYSYNAQITLQCYKTNNSDWLGIVWKNISCFAEGEDHDDKELYPVLYSNGKLTRIDSTKVFPAEMLHILDLYKKGANFEWILDKTSFDARHYELFTVKFNWDGEKFVADPETPLVQIADPFVDGNFDMMITDINIGLLQEPDKKYGVKSDGTLKASDGTTLAKLTLEDGKMTGYTILGKNIGLKCYSGHNNGKAAALGFPMQNVIENNTDTSLTKTSKDGKLVVTLHIKHDDNKMRDIFYEFAAKDESSPIENIRVYSVPFTADFVTELNKYKNLLPETKATFLALNITERMPELGFFKSLSGLGKNISLRFESGSYHFQIYPADEGGEYVLFIKTEYNGDTDAKAETAKWWHHKDGKFTPTNIAIPARPFNDEKYALGFNDEGIHYDNIYEKDFRSYPWNGKKFVNEYEEEESTDTDVDNYPSVEFWLMQNFNDFTIPEVAKRKKSMSISPMVSEEFFSGDEYSMARFVYACYPLKGKKDTYLALCYQEQTDNTGIDLYKLISGIALDYYKENPFDTDLIKEDTSDYARHQYGFCCYLSDIDDKGFLLCTDNDKIRFNWNGEKFVKQ